MNYLTWLFSNHWFLKFSGERKSLRDGKEADSKFKGGGYGKLKKWGGWALAAGSLREKKKKQINKKKWIGGVGEIIGSFLSTTAFVHHFTKKFSLV